MADTETCPRLLREALFGRHDAEERLSRALLGEAAVAAALAGAVVLAPGGRTMVVQELTRSIEGLLSIDVVDVVLGGWKRQHDLKKAARRTMAEPDETQLVKLATHVIAFSEDPTIDVAVDDVTILSVAVHLSLTATVDGLVARVERGRLTALHEGTIEVTGRLRIRETTVAESRCTLDPGVDVPLGDGVPLLTTAEVGPDRGRVHEVLTSG